jgi:hypothetical protein
MAGGVWGAVGGGVRGGDGSSACDVGRMGCRPLACACERASQRACESAPQGPQAVKRCTQSDKFINVRRLITE